MAYNEYLAERIASDLNQKGIPFLEKKMFGGICFMVDEKMCVGVVKEQLMARVDPEEEAKLLNEKGAELMKFTGRPMKGYLFISDDGWDADKDLSFWVDKCLAFNPKAKSSKKK